MNKYCVILVTDKNFKDKALNTLHQLRTIGDYSGDVVIIIGDDLKDQLDVTDENTHIKYYPNHKSILKDYILTDKESRYYNNSYNRSFQFHKFNIFDEYFKQWDKCLYIDAGMHIFKPIERILNLDCKDKLLAHSDSYPDYVNKLSFQFDGEKYPEMFEKLNKEYDLDIDYFQSTMMLYDPNISESNTVKRLQELSEKYISKTNDQGIFNLYFNNERKLWEQIKIKDNETFYYDFMHRQHYTDNNYIMVKYNRQQINEKYYVP